MKQETVQLLQKLIRIDSYNPPGNEKEIILFIRDYLLGLGIKSKIYEFKKNRPNLVCNIKSKKGSKKLLFTPHVDVVPALGKWRYPPLSGKIVNNKIYGRGASDCKVHVAGCLSLIRKLKEESGLDNLDLVFAFCCDEETGSHYGTIPLMKKIKKIDYGVVLDVAGFDIIVAQKGMLHLNIEIFGKASHGAFPELGVNAIEKASLIINKIIKEGFNYKSHSLLKKPTIIIGKFTGGDKVNIVADYACFQADIRYLPLMAEKDIINKIVKTIKSYKVKHKVSVIARQSPIEVDKKSFLIKILQDSLKEKNIPVKLNSSFGATVINYLCDQNIEAFSFGFGSVGQAHTVNEYVEVKNLNLGVDILYDYVKRLDKRILSE